MKKNRKRHREKHIKPNTKPFDQKHFLKVFFCLFIIAVISVIPAIAYGEGKTHFLGIGKCCHYILQTLSFPLPYLFANVRIGFWPLQIIGFVVGFLIDLVLYSLIIHTLILYFKGKMK